MSGPPRASSAPAAVLSTDALPPQARPVATGPAASDTSGDIAALRALAWSYSRHRLLAGCERAVYWNYFGAHGLGLSPRDPVARYALALKLLTALPLVLGSAVHNAARILITAIVDDAPRPSYEMLLNGARWTLNHVWRCSQPDVINRHWEQPWAWPALQEIVYRGVVAPEEIDQVRARLERCLTSLCDAPLLEDVRAAGRDGVRIGFGRAELFRVSGAGPAADLPVWAAHDLVYLHNASGSVPAGSGSSSDRSASATMPSGVVQNTVPEGAVSEAVAGEEVWAGTAPVWCIVDLKTGRRDDAAERLQLATYGLWLEATGVPRTDGAYLGRIVDLLTPEDRWYRIGDDALSDARALIAEDVERQRALLIDPARGLPRPKRDWALAADRRHCNRCRFFELCRDELRPIHERATQLRATVTGVMGDPAGNGSHPETGGEPDAPHPAERGRAS